MTLRGLSILLLALLTVGAGSLLWWRCEGEAPRLQAPERLAIGRSGADVSLDIADEGSGLRAVRVVLRHAGGEAVLRDDAHPGSLVSGAAYKPSRESLVLRIDPATLGIPEGDAFLDVEARDWSLRGWLSGNLTARSIPLRIDLTPPRVSALTGLTYVRRGGAAVVVYELAEQAERDGVEVAGTFFPGAPMDGAVLNPDGSASRRVALYAVPRNAPENPPIHLVAIDEAGNRSVADLTTRVMERSFEEVRINLSDRFLQSKVPSLASALGLPEGDAVATFQDINTRVRAENEARIQEIVADARPERLFDGDFQQLRNSAVTSRFAEHRRYLYREEVVSEAIHFGYDLASTARDVITAGNRGRVLFAGELGIYGQCVILDHGMGLTSLYAHLSRIDVSVADSVERSGPLGLSGATGLAGGDHLHFAILVHGVYVDPKEWWDPKWVREHIEVQLAPGES